MPNRPPSTFALLPRLAMAAAALLLLAPAATKAQLALPGAVAPAPAGSIAAPTLGKKRVSAPVGEGGGESGRGPAIAPKLPSEDTIVGKALHLDGSRSTIELSRSGADLQVAKLVLTGDRMSRSGEACRIEVTGTPLKVTPRESEVGLHRYKVNFPACPFSFDALDGAILVANEGKACELREADCRADPEGLWGMGAAEFDPKTSKDMLGTRARVEKTMRSNFRALYERNKGDKPLRKLIVREQAGFSSVREEICRDYAQESEYGYCALRVTEARTIGLGNQLAHGVKRPPGLELAEETPAGSKGKRRK